uniref:Uncharacterized protein n=1 Tax=Nelumbo nucifera TaxID=4432 RepID=A0A822ZE02_NELNU|nr:TPA_asm: hypothetical protein HUJ06_001347 [Nelumbo nucifera]
MSTISNKVSCRRDDHHSFSNINLHSHLAYHLQFSKPHPLGRLKDFYRTARRHRLKYF